MRGHERLRARPFNGAPPLRPELGQGGRRPRAPPSPRPNTSAPQGRWRLPQLFLNRRPGAPKSQNEGLSIKKLVAFHSLSHPGPKERGIRPCCVSPRAARATRRTRARAGRGPPMRRGSSAATGGPPAGRGVQDLVSASASAGLWSPGADTRARGSPAAGAHPRMDARAAVPETGACARAHGHLMLSILHAPKECDAPRKPDAPSSFFLFLSARATTGPGIPADAPPPRHAGWRATPRRALRLRPDCDLKNPRDELIMVLRTTFFL